MISNFASGLVGLDSKVFDLSVAYIDFGFQITAKKAFLVS